jgi:hypothetical protein
MWKWESSLVETLTFQSNRKNGTSEEPKFERDLLESRSSFNYREKNPEVLSRFVQYRVYSLVYSTSKVWHDQRPEIPDK